MQDLVVLADQPSLGVAPTDLVQVVAAVPTVIRRPFAALSERAQAVAVEWILRLPSAESRTAYRRDLELFLDFAVDHGVNPEAASVLVAAAYRDTLKACGLAPASVERRLATLSSVYRRLVDKRLVAQNPFSRRETPRDRPDPIHQTPAVSRSDVEKMIASCAADPQRVVGLRDEAIVRVLYATGLRRASVAALDLAQVVPQHEGAAVITVPAKGGRRLRICLPAPVWTSVKAYVDAAGHREGRVFRRTTYRPMSARDIWGVVRRRAAEAGVAASTHSFRAALATRAYDSAVPEREIQGLLGHANPRTTQRYDRRARGETLPAALYDLGA